MTLKKNCEICGKKFIPKPYKANKFCGAKCYHIAQRKGLYKWQTDKRIKNRYICSYCGKEVIAVKRKKRNGEEAEHIFCNRMCYDNFRRLNSDRICKYCGKHFLALNAHKNAQFCDDNCRRSYFAQKTIRYCANCGQSFYPWTFDRLTGSIILDSEVTTCSKKCRVEYKRKREIGRREKISLAFTGEKHPNWQGGKNQYRGENWKHQRFLAKKRDNYICQCCGITQRQAVKKYGSGLEVHHKIPYVFFGDDYFAANDLSNLVSLCRSCHQKTEWKYRKEHEDEYKKFKAS